MLIGIGLQLINSYIFFDESHKFSKNSLQKVDNIIGHLISTFPKKYSKWRKMSPEISRVSENLSEYSSKEEFISEIACHGKSRQSDLYTYQKTHSHIQMLSVKYNYDEIQRA